MRIGIITPCKTYDADRLDAVRANIASLTGLDGHEVLHVVVVDGRGDRYDHAQSRVDLVRSNTTYVEFTIPESSNDAGATPRAIGSTYALAQGCSVVAFLDDDNTYEPKHISNAVELIQMGADVVASLRTFMHPDGTSMYVDSQDSNGVTFADTNTIVLGNKAAQFSTTWSWYRQRSGTDRIFFDRLRHSFGDKIVCTQQPTVNYVTNWAVHFNIYNQETGQPIFTPPEELKFVRVNEKGERYTLVSKAMWDPNRKAFISVEDNQP